MAREQRWIILMEDGRHVTLGRNAEPTDDGVGLAGYGLQTQALDGWLAALECRHYRSRETLTLLMVGAIALSADGDWEDAAAACQRIRDDATCAA